MPRSDKTLKLADDDVLRGDVLAAVRDRIAGGTHPITAFAVLLECAITIGLSSGATLEDLVESCRIMWREVQENKRKAS
jgi:hypothetical protein